MVSRQNAAKVASNDTQSAAQKSESAVRQEFAHFVKDLEDLVQSTSSLTGAELEQARAKLSERVSQAKDTLGTFSDSLSERAKDIARSTDEYVHEQPWQSVGITAGVGAAVGFLLGMLAARR